MTNHQHLEPADVTKHPLPAESAAWYAGCDEELLPIGPCDSREQVIQEAIASEVFKENDDGSRIVLIGKYANIRVNLADYFDAEEFLERASEAMDNNDEGGDEYGDRHPCHEIDDDATADLQKVVRETIWKWQRDHGLHLKSWALRLVEGDEAVPVNGASTTATQEPTP
ncbi:hypothetical protein [Pleomorphomonas oryzae]|uniref:hypothetical protein n=1 Tax=Pleomorphomonas oryzae TaxID=261934 RepID=UPI000428C6AE|nr:hypothetical protein [Pleomorphomonas oryzae]